MLLSQTSQTIICVQHGSDSGTYDSEGRFVPQHFEDIFAKYSHSSSRCPFTLGKHDLAALHKGNRNAVDPFGWFATVFEFFAAWWLSDGELEKEELRGIYDVRFILVCLWFYPRIPFLMTFLLMPCLFF